MTLSIALVSIIIILSLPIFSIMFLKKRKSDLENIQEQFGSLFLNLRIHSKMSDVPLWNSTIFFTRRIMIGLVTVFLFEHQFTQVYIMNISSLLMMSYILQGRPYEILVLNLTEMLNEGFLYISSLYMMCFTDFVTDVNTRYFVGELFFFSVIIVVGLNVSLIVFQIMLGSFKKYKLNKKKKENKEIWK